MNDIPQKEKGFLQITSGKKENDILSALISMRLNGTEYQIILTVIRKTWGWNKKEDWISISQFEKITGKDRSFIIKTIGGLVDKKLLVKKSTLGKITKLSIQKDITLWDIKLVDNTPLVDKKPLTSGLLASQLVDKKPPTINTITKDTNTITPQAELVLYFSNIFNKRFKKPYMPFKTDYINMASLTKTYPLDKIKTYIEWYIYWNNWKTKSGYNIGHFYKNINSVTSSASPYSY